MAKIKIATFNINSIRIRQHDLLEWMQKDNIDLVALQETKAQDKDFPLETFTNAGYTVAYKGEKSRNGVAIISNKELTNISYGLDDIGEEGEARLIKADFHDFTIINTYVPQGREVATDYFQYKLNWLRGMKNYLDKYTNPSKKVIWLGDLNVALEAIDVHDAKKLAGEVGYHPDEQAALQYTMQWGLSDLFRKHVPEANHYTFWDYRITNALERGVGWRIDYIMASKSAAKQSTNSYIYTDLRKKERPSDHTPLVVEFEI